MNSKKFLIYIFLVLFVNTLYIFADEKLKFAESFEKSGDYKNAARLYSELFESNPKINNYFDGLVRSYKAMNQFSELIPFIEKKLNIQKTADIYGIYGEMLWRTGKIKEANEAWEKGIQSQQNNKETYDKISESQIAVKQFEKAIETYKKGREFYKNEVIFSDELSQLYTVTGDAVKGLEEILKSFEYSHNTPIAEGRLSALKLIKGADVLIDKELNARYSETDNYEGYRLLIWHLRSKNDLEKSLVLTEKLDKIMNSNGIELSNFARISQMDGHYDIALKAYELVVQKGERNPNFQNALFGIARTLEQQMEFDNKFDEINLKRIIEKYKDIVKKYPNSSSAFDCQYRIGVINLNYLKNIEQAKNEFSSLYSNKINYNAVGLAGINLGNISIMENKLEEAKKIFKDIIIRFRGGIPDIVDQAKLSIAEIYFYSGDIDSALIFYNDASMNNNSNIANNALEMIDIIENNKTQNLALREFAEARLLEKRNLIDSAAKIYKKAMKSGAGSDLEEVSALKSANVYFQSNNYDKAIPEFKDFLTKYPSSIFADNAAFNLGKSFFILKNFKDADAAFKDLLVKYPRSLNLGDARKYLKFISDEEKKRIN